MADGVKLARVTINGVEQLYYTECEVEVASNDKPLETAAGGLVGHSDGSTMYSLKGTSVVPNTGREFDFVAACGDHVTTSFGWRLAGKGREFRGRFLTATEQSKAGDTVTIAWTYQGRKIRG